MPLVVTEEDGSTLQAYSDRDRSQASFCLGQTKAVGSGGWAMALLFLLFEKFFIELF